MVTLTTFLIPFIHIYALHFSEKASHYLLQKGKCFRFFFLLDFPVTSRFLVTVIFTRPLNDLVLMTTSFLYLSADVIYYW